MTTAPRASLLPSLFALRSSYFPTAVGLLLACPGGAWADEHAGPPVPAWAVLPFVGLLLGIAGLPILAPRFWHSNARKALVALGLSAPVVAYLAYLDAHGDPSALPRLGHALLEYVDFIVLLAALYTVAGGIVLDGQFRPGPGVNTAFLLAGAVLANLIGTTGASMLLVRPVLRINRARPSPRHVPIFFIFCVSNLGGLLTPLGDPPLFLGFLNGVDFFWTLTLLPHWLVAVGTLLGVFFVWDLAVAAREPAAPPPAAGAAPFRIRGLVNGLFLAGILAAVLLQSDEIARLLPAPVSAAARAVTDLVPPADAAGGWRLHRPWPGLVMAGMALLSLACTPRGLRRQNDFAWAAIAEVAVLFAGVFVTMVPALALLAQSRAALGITEPWQYFWLTGGLSSVLDNAPTYLTFATIAAEGPQLGRLMAEQPQVLQAVSAGAVFMGALTYIGNGPNFMVKAIAETAGYRMPSFFGYVGYSTAVLGPIFAVVTYLFFL